MKSFELKPTFENLMDTFLNDSIGLHLQNYY